MEKTKITKARFVGGAIILGAGAAVLFSFVVMWLWNWLMPTIFNLGVITFWQAAGLLILSKILFSSHGHGSKWHDDHKKKYWQSRFHDKWHNVSDEKKQEFAQKMKDKGFCSKSEEEAKEE